ncbi:MAG: hypothetical protein A3H97_14920 [Acidobacteria bacterium RIFCSPLOWO2_02_FULL_65_29]|nr:MAG: hypothetical protein A3H97_14920 [Acidobacteria bacterium RIFCSPLOWO2_02_FULL_65_29]
MSLALGTRLGPYEILGLLGAGGMGEVYRATDTNLKRAVAIKVLPASVAGDAERLARFQREAEVLASLNHPNIAQIHGLEKSAGTPALVMELVEGPTLADLIAGAGAGPRALSIEDALPIARQIAEALEAAHERGIIHRDLKPANIKVRPDGVVKVLDFGLAKALEGPAAAADVSQSPTMSVAATRAGVILGTAAYMSPEQARAKPVDKRADIWAFGCVLYEMLTGRRAFEGSEVTDVLAAVLASEPKWNRLPSGLHPRLLLLLERCLEKDPRDRYHDIADARVDVQKVAADPLDASARRRSEATPSSLSRGLPWAAAGLALSAVVAGFAAWSLRPPDPSPISRLSHLLPDGQAFTNTVRSLVAMSPDGSSIVYVANNQLYIRPLSALEATPVRGTDGSPSTPFFSPDGQSIGYWDSRDAQLKRIAAAGGTPVRLADATTFYGASWGTNGSIVYGQEDGVWRVSADQGTPERIVEIEAAERVHGPQILPDEKSLLFTLLSTAQRPGSAAWDEAQVVVQSLEAGERKAIVTGSDGRYVPTGHLVYALNTVLFAVSFDASTQQIQGAPVPIVEGVQRATRTPGSSASANYGFSEQGTLAYVPAAADRGSVQRSLVAVDRKGNTAPLLDEQREYWRPRVSPDGGRVAVEVRDGVREHIWIADLGNRTASPLVVDGDLNVFAAWTPDGQSLVFRSNRDRVHGIYRQKSDGSEKAVLLSQRPGEPIPTAVSPNGVVAFAEGSQTGLRAIWTLRLEDGAASEFLATPAMEHMALFSPDGEWLAYVSNESGRDEVYVRPYPKTDGVGRRVSIDGGTAPVWARDGSELYYRSASGDLMAVPTTMKPSFTPGRPQPLFRFSGRFRASGNASAYDVLGDGKRFVMVTEPTTPPSEPRQINVVQNWFEELKRLVPAK